MLEIEAFGGIGIWALKALRFRGMWGLSYRRSFKKKWTQ